ncbi:hypothetical protein DL98DRAFT_433770 [Cadophora sp. DSE1049]|nr:hypothetical protein DL98DRAFT_433770 [Cadophora sp. DSE1049]
MYIKRTLGAINSQILSTQQREFHEALGGEGESEVVCFYEALKSPTAIEVRRGSWQMKGPPTVLVTKSSATHCRSWENGPEHICAINRTHSGMVKFGPQDHEYDKALQRIQGLVRQALTTQSQRQGSNTESM